MKITITLIFLLLTNLFFAQERNCVSGNCVNGKGKLQITSYSYYEGQFVNKQFNGKGTFEDDDYLYTGEWKDGGYNGKGKLSVKNHGVQAKTVPFYQVYEGEFIDGIKNGQGLLAGFISKDTNSVYKGNFKNNEFYGKGSFHVYPFCVYKSDNWIDSQNFASGTMTRDDSKLVYNGAYVKSSFNENKVATTPATNTVVTTAVTGGSLKTYCFRTTCSNQGKTFEILSKVSANIVNHPFAEIKIEAQQYLRQNGWIAYSATEYLGIFEEIHVTGVAGKDYAVLESGLYEFKKN